MTDRPSSQKLADRVRERLDACREVLAESPFRSPVATGWYAEDVDALVARLQATEQALQRCDEANERCTELRVALIRGEVPDQDVSRAYATATAPLAAAIAEYRRALEGATE